MEHHDFAELARVLTGHAKRYPRMGPADAVKLVFQNEFGGGHLIADPAKSLASLRAEYAAKERDPAAPLLEDIGGGLVRVMLAALDEKEYPLEELNRDFVRSARLHTGTRAAFLQKLETVRRLAREGTFGFSAQALEGYLSSYLKSGCPPVSHSGEYRQAYGPAYRVVLRPVSLPLLTLEIRRLLTRRSRLLIAIDGRCASGKTTLAARLGDQYGFSVVHMDDFFLRPRQRTPERYAAPGENIDHERFLAEVLLPLHGGKAPEYRPFDCRTQQLAAPVRVKASPVTVIEGSYSCHPALWPYYDLHIFLSVPPEEQMRRLTAREGPESAAVFRRKWIPLEERYLTAYQLESRCEYRPCLW